MGISLFVYRVYLNVMYKNYLIYYIHTNIYSNVFMYLDT